MAALIRPWMSTELLPKIQTLSFFNVHPQRKQINLLSTIFLGVSSTHAVQWEHGIWWMLREAWIDWIVYLLQWFRRNYPAGDNFFSYRSCHWLVMRQQVKADWLSRKKGERKWLLVEADVRGVGTCDKPLRTFAWEASSLLVQEDQSKQDKKTANERVEFHKAK